MKPVIPLQIGDSTEDTDSDTSNDSGEESDNHKTDIDETGDGESVCGNIMKGDTEISVIKNVGEGDKNDLMDNDDDMEEDKSMDDNDGQSSGSDVTVAYCDNSDTNSSYSSHDYSRESSPFLSSDLRPRRSARLDKSSDASREASPLIYESDYGLPHSRRSRARLKPIKYKASRNLTNFLVDENSTTSNSSAFGEPSISGILTERLLNNANLNINSNSSETGEESNDCDIQKLFINPGNESTKGKSDLVTDQSKDRQESDKDCNSNDGASESLENETKRASVILNDKLTEDGIVKDGTNREASLPVMETDMLVSNDLSFDNGPVESLSESIPNGYLIEAGDTPLKDSTEKSENRLDEGNRDMSEEHGTVDGGSEKGKQDMDVVQFRSIEHSMERVLCSNQIDNLDTSDIVVNERERDLSIESDTSRHIETFREDLGIRNCDTNNIKHIETSDLSNSNSETAKYEINKKESHRENVTDQTIDRKGSKDQTIGDKQPDETGYTSLGDRDTNAIKTVPLDFTEKNDETEISFSEIKDEPETSNAIDKNSLTEIKIELNSCQNMDNVLNTEVETGTNQTSDIASLSKVKDEPETSKIKDKDSLSYVKKEQESSQDMNANSLPEKKAELGTSLTTAAMDSMVTDELKVNVKMQQKEAKSLESVERNEKTDEKLPGELVPENEEAEEEEEVELVTNTVSVLATSVETCNLIIMFDCSSCLHQ